MGNAIQLAHEQTIRLNNHLSEGTENTAQEFFAQPEEVKVTQKILSTLNANHSDY